MFKLNDTWVLVSSGRTLLTSRRFPQVASTDFRQFPVDHSTSNRRKRVAISDRERYAALRRIGDSERGGYRKALDLTSHSHRLPTIPLFDSSAHIRRRFVCQLSLVRNRIDADEWSGHYKPSFRSDQGCVGNADRDGRCWESRVQRGDSTGVAREDGSCFLAQDPGQSRSSRHRTMLTYCYSTS